MADEQRDPTRRSGVPRPEPDKAGAAPEPAANAKANDLAANAKANDLAANAKADDLADDLVDVVARKQARKERSRAEGRRGLAYGFGVFGLVGWSVALPTLLGIGLGVWIDKRYPSPYSWTLMLMIAGLMVGLFNAWYWVRKETGDE